MSTAVTVLVLVAIAFVIGVGLAAGLDVYAAAILGFILLIGALALAIAGRTRSGGVGPAHCPRCNRAVSPHAPYCNHCGARLGDERGPADGGSARRSGAGMS